MSLSVDDLVSSFGSSHIGQEAIDLAALHAQLAQTLFTSTTTRQRSNTNACNTPIARTPSSSFSFSHMPGRSTAMMMDDMDEDERMVEEQLLMPSSPVVVSQQSSAQLQYQYHYVSQQQAVSPSPSFVTETSPSSSSVFASTDPFYLAAMQQAQQQQHQQQSSFFAQNGRLCQNSPFFARQPPSSSVPMSVSTTSQRENHPHRHSLTIDTSHSIFAAASTAY